MSIQLGFYKWSYAGGDFSVCFRPNGIFFCSKFPAAATWEIQGGKLVVDWKKFGVYEFALSGTPVLEGSSRGSPENWRRIEFVRDFNATERQLLANGFGSVWDFGWEKGSFEVEFHVDGYNHFVCKQYPAHSHWDIDESGLVTVNWGKYGTYELRLDAATGELHGSAQGQPTNWRKARLLRALGAEALSDASHGHSHDHGHGCGQDHGKSDCCHGHGKGDCDHHHGKGGCDHHH